MKNTPRSFALVELLSGLILLVGAGAMLAAPGDLDDSFGNGGKVSIHLDHAFADEWAHSVVVQGDGRLLLGGYVNTSHGVVRFNSDGTLDASFGSSGKVLPAFGLAPDAGVALAIQPTGKILEAGTAFSVTRYDTNGILDRSFGGTGRVATQLGAFSDVALDMMVQSDGKILLGGYSAAGPEQDYDQDFALVRYNAGGSLDHSFSDDGKQRTDFGDKIDRCTSLAVQTDGKIVAAGYSGASWAMARYHADGTLDATFGNNGKVTTTTGSRITAAPKLAMHSDGKILLAGTASNRFTILRLNPNGSLDTSFGVGGRVSTQVGGGPSSCSGVAVQPDGKIVAAGTTWDGSRNLFAVTRYHYNGNLDATWGGSGMVLTGAGFGSSAAQDVALQPNGKILVAGRVWNGTYSDFGVVRYEGDAAPIITANPVSQTVTVGATVTFTVEASGTSRLSYQWRFNDTDILAANGPTLSLTNVQLASAGAYSVLVSNYLGFVTSSIAVLSVNRPPVAHAGTANRLVVSANDSNATVILDGSSSFDPDGGSLEYRWLAGDTGETIATSVVAVVTLPLGTSSFILEVCDGLAKDTDSTIIDVVTQVDAVGRILLGVENSSLGPIRELLLRASLQWAIYLLQHDHPFAGVIQLERFKQIVQLLVEPYDSGLADRWIGETQVIIDAVKFGRGGGSALERLSALLGEAEMPATMRDALRRWMESAIASQGSPEFVIVQLEQLLLACHTGLASSDPELSQVLEDATYEAIEEQRGDRGLLRVGLSPDLGRVRLAFSAWPGLTYCIEASSNMVDWEIIGLATQIAPGEFQYDDAHLGRSSTRFYRFVRP